MSAVQQLLMAYGAAAGGGSSFSIAGVSTNSSTTTISVPAGAAAGDLLVLLYTNGSSASFTMVSGFTAISTGGTGCGAIGYRTMVAGDTSFTLPGTEYATLIAVHRSSGTPAIDQSSLSSFYTVNSTFTTPTLTPSVADTLSLMLFVSGQGAFTGAPGYTQLITYNVSGVGSCGMAASWTALSTTAAFAGTTATGVATTSHDGVACHIIVK
jgi:hypothetical protein